MPPQPVVCLEAKSDSADAELRSPIPAKPGSQPNRTMSTSGAATANVFGVVEPKTGRHFTTATPDRSGAEFAGMSGMSVKPISLRQDHHLVMDNLNSHSSQLAHQLLRQQEGGYLWIG